MRRLRRHSQRCLACTPAPAAHYGSHAARRASRARAHGAAAPRALARARARAPLARALARLCRRRGAAVAGHAASCTATQPPTLDFTRGEKERGGGEGQPPCSLGAAANLAAHFVPQPPRQRLFGVLRALHFSRRSRWAPAHWGCAALRQALPGMASLPVSSPTLARAALPADARARVRSRRPHRTPPPSCCPAAPGRLAPHAGAAPLHASPGAGSRRRSALRAYRDQTSSSITPEEPSASEGAEATAEAAEATAEAGASLAAAARPGRWLVVLSMSAAFICTQGDTGSALPPPTPTPCRLQLRRAAHVPRWQAE